MRYRNGQRFCSGFDDKKPATPEEENAHIDYCLRNKMEWLLHNLNIKAVANLDPYNFGTASLRGAVVDHTQALHPSLWNASLEGAVFIKTTIVTKDMEAQRRQQIANIITHKTHATKE